MRHNHRPSLLSIIGALNSPTKYMKLKITLLLVLLVLILLPDKVTSECPNACSGHGLCGAFDSCLCQKNWMANDCSHRMCQFGKAHVDTPLGDLDASGGTLSGPSTDDIVARTSDLYPKGANEQYPNMVDSDDNVIEQTAHGYRECSNKGICDRLIGECVCFDGYEGTACQRASCPVVNNKKCSGHGTCESIKEFAAADNHNIYKLWDEDITMGCLCDPGYDGPVCNNKKCNYGYDPLYSEAEPNNRFSNWTIQFYTADKTPPNKYNDQFVIGNYSIIFYDIYGDDWETGPIDINARCDDITSALESLPNDVIMRNSVLCFNWASGMDTNTNMDAYSPRYDPKNKGFPWGRINYTDSEWVTDRDVIIHTRYTLAFPENPGRLQQIRINKFLDGNRPTLFSMESGNEQQSTLGWSIYANGFTGEFTDYVNDLCEGVYIKMDGRDLTTGYHKILPINAKGISELAKFKACLGHADDLSANNADKLTYDWDAGTTANPHLIKLIDASYKLHNDKLDELNFGIPGSHSDGITQFRRAGQLESFQQLNSYDVPVSRLCSYEINPDPSRDLPPDTPLTYCSRYDPPGFYVVTYYKEGVFYTFNNFQDDKGPYKVNAKTMFFVFTTTGTLQELNPMLSVYNIDDDWSIPTQIQRAHTNILHTTVTKGVSNDPYIGIDPLPDHSCEFDAYVRENNVGYPNVGALACLNKGDFVFMFNKYNNVISQDTNPLYLNMYQVNKIYKAEMSKFTDVGVLDDNSMVKASNTMQQIVLDYGTNARYVYKKSATNSVQNPSSYQWKSSEKYEFVIRIAILQSDEEKCSIGLLPTRSPTTAPTAAPTVTSTAALTNAPTEAPTFVPTAAPTRAPTAAPTRAPTAAPTLSPSILPTKSPTIAPTRDPSAAPTLAPSAKPTLSPTFYVNSPVCRVNPSNDNKGCSLRIGEIEIYDMRNISINSNISYYNVTNERKPFNSLAKCLDGNLKTQCIVGNSCPLLAEVHMGNRPFSKISLKNVTSIIDGAVVSVLANGHEIFSTIIHQTASEVDYDIFPDNFPILETFYHSAPERGGFLMSSLYKFIPPTDSEHVFNYVSECSGRGLCDVETGICDCFRGYTGGDCSDENALAI